MPMSKTSWKFSTVSKCIKIKSWFHCPTRKKNFLLSLVYFIHSENGKTRKSERLGSLSPTGVTAVLSTTFLLCSILKRLPIFRSRTIYSKRSRNRTISSYIGWQTRCSFVQVCSSSSRTNKYTHLSKTRLSKRNLIVQQRQICYVNFPY